MVYLFLGDNLEAKDARIAEIKNKFFVDFPQAGSFDCDNLECADLQANQLRQALLTLPVIAPKRLIVLRGLNKIKDRDIPTLLDFCQKPFKHCELVLESADHMLKGSLKDLPAYAKSAVLARPAPPNVFDMTRLMTAQKNGEALKMLDSFFRDNVHPLQIMPALVWFWGKEGKARGSQRFGRGLKALEEADLNIKRSRLDPQYALEKLVVELGLLLRH
ncbi:MAG: hypothetical protein HQL13_07245 [Candidatus Omnitrophica bacterium]|nr:hypothetical protein [Candidatus Omnitrophota bacterium]